MKQLSVTLILVVSVLTIVAMGALIHVLNDTVAKQGVTIQRNNADFLQRENRLRTQIEVWENANGACQEKLRHVLEEEKVLENFGLGMYTLEELAESMAGL